MYSFFATKCYWEHENIKDVQRQFRKWFHSGPPTRRTIARIRDSFEADGIIHGVHNPHSGAPWSSTSPRKRTITAENPPPISKEICTTKWWSSI